jgi:hypothetical protein
MLYCTNSAGILIFLVRLDAGLVYILIGYMSLPFFCSFFFQILAYKSAFSGSYKVPRSPTPYSGKLFSRSESETKRKTIVHDDRDMPISFLADSGSMFIACQGITVHYKISNPSTCLSSAPDSFTERDTHHDVVSSSLSPRRHRHENPPSASSNTCHLLNRSFSHQYHQTSLYAPLLVEPVTSPTLSDEVPLMSLDDDSADECLNTAGFDLEAGEQGKFAIVLVHGFGGGVFSWRHVSNLLARQVGCTVLAFDRPGWGLTSRPRRKDWEDKKLPNPYELDSQVILLIYSNILLSIFHFPPERSLTASVELW